MATLQKKKELKTLFSNTLMLYIMQISAYVFPLITFPWLTRALGPEKYGVMNVANAIIVYFQLFVDFGFLLSATRECSIHRDDKSKLQNIVSSVVQAKLIISLVGLAVMLLLTCFIGEFRNNAFYLILAYLSVFFSVFVPDYLFRGVEKMHTITYRSIISRALYTALVILFVRMPEDYLLVPIFNAASNLFIVVWSWALVVKKFKIKYKVVSFKETFKAMKQSSIFFASRIASTVYSASNVFILGMVFGTNSPDMGQFTAANNLVTNGRSMFSPIADSLYPYMVQKKNYKLVKIIMLIAAPVIVAGTAILFIFADWFIELFCGAEYLVGNPNAVDVFRAMTPMFLITLPIYILGFPVLGAMNMMKEANYTVMYAAVFHTIGLCALYFTGYLSFIPVALLTCASECVVLGSRIFYVCKGRKRLKKERELNEETA